MRLTKCDTINFAVLVKILPFAFTGLLLLQLETSCSSWPTPSAVHDCSDWEWPVVLNAYMRLSETVSCGSLCKQQNKEGCCYINDLDGCLWTQGANAMVLEVMRTVSQCSVTGMLDNSLNMLFFNIIC